jgi:hypothetical protein
MSILRGLSFSLTTPTIGFAVVAVRLIRDRRMRVPRVIDLLRLDHALNRSRSIYAQLSADFMQRH